MTAPVLTQARLKELLHYDPETGVFTWLQDRYCGNGHNRISVHKGDVAGCVTRYGKNKYVEIRIDKRKHFGHRLAFLYMGVPVPRIVDHRDEDGLNNRFLNLRPASRSTNGMNRGVPVNNTSGAKGVFRSKKDRLWMAYVGHGGKRTIVGWFSSFEAAVAARIAKANELHGQFARHS